MVSKGYTAGTFNIPNDVANEKTFVGGDAPANERRAAAEANRFRKP